MGSFNDAQARQALAASTGAPNSVSLFAIASGLDPSGVPLTGGVSAKLLKDLLHVWFRPHWRGALDRDSELPDFPYQPPGVSHEALRTPASRVAVSLADADEVALRAFAKAVVPPLVKARVFDVLWERFRRPDDAADAIDALLAYVAVAKDEAWTDANEALGRAASLIALRKDTARANALLAAFDHAANVVLAGSYFFAYARIADTFYATVLRAKSLRPSVPNDFRERWVVVLHWLSERFFSADAHYGHSCFVVLGEWLAVQGATAKAEAARRRLVEHLLACAYNGSALVGSSHASAALSEAFRFGFPDLIEASKKVIQNRVLASHAEMETRAFEFTLPAEVISEIDNLTGSAPTAQDAVRALGGLVGLCDVPVTALKGEAAKQMRQSVFTALMPSMHMRAGKIAFLANDPDAKLREAIGRNADAHLAAVEHLLARALHRLAARLTPSTMFHAVAGCPWISRERLPWLERASERFHSGDMMSSGLIVAMQYEAIVRDLARAAGLSALKTEGDGTLLDETLGSLLRQQKLRGMLGDDHLFFVDYVLGNPELGPNLRNELAHGNARPWDLTAPRVFLIWLFVVRLTFFGPVHDDQGYSVRPDPSPREIAELAYLRWLERGCPHGDSVEDWLAAERELRARAV
jgi:hypothetical protein